MYLFIFYTAFSAIFMYEKLEELTPKRVGTVTTMRLGIHIVLHK